MREQVRGRVERRDGEGDARRGPVGEGGGAGAARPSGDGQGVPADLPGLGGAHGERVGDAVDLTAPVLERLAQFEGEEPGETVAVLGGGATGDAVARAAGAKRLVLELGGNAATIVCADADVAEAARICARTGYSNSGQSCISVQRVYVHRSRFEEFLGLFTGHVESLTVGDPLDPATDVGAMVDEDAAERVVRWSAEAAEAGGRVLTGGTRDGATAMPTVVADPPASCSVVAEEVFGALVAVLPFDDLDRVIEQCNESRYGLQAGLFTQDMDRIITAWRDLEVGGLVVNGSSNFRLDHVPFGGVKDSGFGRESPRCMIDDYTVVKTMMLRGTSLWGTE